MPTHQEINEFEDSFDVDLEAEVCYCCGELFPREALLETDSQLLCDLCTFFLPDDTDWNSPL